MLSKKKNLKTLNIFNSTNKLNSYRQIKKKEKRKENKKKKKFQKQLQNKSKYKNDERLDWVCTVSVLSLARSPPYLPRICSNVGCLLDLLLGGQFRLQSDPTPVFSCLQCPRLSELVCFLLWGLSLSFNIFQKHRICLVDCVDLICSLYSWWEEFGSYSNATLPLGFNCDCLHLCMWVIYRGLLLRLPWRTWVCPSEDQVWRWQPTPVFLLGESPGQRSLAGHSPQHHKDLDMPEATTHAQLQDFLSLLAALSQWASCVGVMQLLGSQGPCQCWPFRSSGGYCHRR